MLRVEGCGLRDEGDQGADGLEEENGVFLVLAVQRDLLQGKRLSAHSAAQLQRCSVCCVCDQQPASGSLLATSQSQ